MHAGTSMFVTFGTSILNIIKLKLTGLTFSGVGAPRDASSLVNV